MAVATQERSVIEKTDPLEYLDYKVGKLELRDGDILVFRTEHMLNKDQCTYLRQHIEDIIGPRMEEMGITIMVLTAGIDVAVLRKEAAEHDRSAS